MMSLLKVVIALDTTQAVEKLSKEIMQRKPRRKTYSKLKTMTQK